MTEKNISRGLSANGSTAQPRRVMGVTNRESAIRIGLDARSIFMPHPRGTGRNLLDAYRLIPAMRPDWQFVLYHQRDGACDDLTGLPNVRTRRIDIPGDRFDLWLQVRLPAAAWRNGVDLLHLPANAAPKCSPVPVVVTVHDLAPLRHTGGGTDAERRAFRRGVLRAVSTAAHIISPSTATRDELCAEFNVDAERISVIPWAPDQGILRAVKHASDTERQHQIDRVRASYGLADAYLLNFSGSSPRKNARGLLDAYARLSASVRAATQLVIVGCEPASFRADLEERIQDSGLQHDCRLLGFVPHEDLPWLLCGARGLVMPSLCEGFGLPILDAFACGTPVLTSNLSSMPEIAEQAAVYCDPRDPNSIADGIVRLLDPTIGEKLRQAGYERSQEFSWERTARLMCDVYEHCTLQGKRSGVQRRPVAATSTETCGV